MELELSDGPFTTLTVAEYNRLSDTIKDLRKRIQKCREFLEKKDTESALKLLKESDL
jgi:hypothetical protein